MARKQATLIALGLAVAGWTSLAEEPRPPQDPLAAPATAPKPEGEKPERPERDKQRRSLTGPEAEKAREAFKKMSPEEREQWLKRFREWASMPPEKKKGLQDREEFFRRRMREDIDNSIQQSGLTLTEEQKQQYAQRYMEERRKIEAELRKEMDELRKPKVQALIEKLKQEFGAQKSQ